MSRPARPARFAALALALTLVVVGGCGIGVDRSPRPIEKSQQKDLGATRPADGGGLPSTGEQRVFLVADVGKTGGSRLRQVSRNAAATPGEALVELFKGPTQEELNNKLRTAIPTGTTLLSASTSGDLVTVNLDGSLAATGGDRQILAVAQIVYTLTSIDGVRRVRILIDGVSREWPTEDGTPRSEPLTRFAYAELDPSTQTDLPPIPSPTTPTTFVTRTSPPPPAASSATSTSDPAKS